MTSPNSFYAPNSDQEGIFTYPNGEHEDIQDPAQFQPPAHDQFFGETEIANDYAYAPQTHAAPFYDSSASGAPSNQLYPHNYFHELPYYDMTENGSYLDPNPFGIPPAVSGSAAQQYYTGSQPFTEPHHQPAYITMLPTAPVELTDPMVLDFRSSPQRSPRVTSRIGGPSTPSSLNTSDVALYSHSPTTPLNRTSQSPGFAGPGCGTGSRQSPMSPKRSFESSADDSPHGRRVIPRHAGSSNVHSGISGGIGTTTLSITSRVPGRGQTIPQSLYNVGTTHAFHFSSSNGMVVTFNVAGETGIPLHQLLTRQSSLLQGRDERISYMSGHTASIRIEWPGYPSFTKQIASKDWKKTRLPNTREKLAMKVAGAVKTFFQKHANTTCDPPNSMWRIGANGIRVEDLAIVSLHRVSQGSWQPKLCLLHDNAQH